MVHSTPLVPVLTQPNVRALYHQSRKITTQYHKNRQLWQPNASDATCQRVSSLLRVTLLYIQAGLYLTLYTAQQCTCCQRAVNKSPRNCFFGDLVFVLSHRISTILIASSLNKILYKTLKKTMKARRDWRFLLLLVLQLVSLDWAARRAQSWHWPHCAAFDLWRHGGGKYK